MLKHGHFELLTWAIRSSKGPLQENCMTLLWSWYAHSCSVFNMTMTQSKVLTVLVCSSPILDPFQNYQPFYHDILVCNVCQKYGAGPPIVFLFLKFVSYTSILFSPVPTMFGTYIMLVLTIVNSFIPPSKCSEKKPIKKEIDYLPRIFKSVLQ